MSETVYVVDDDQDLRCSMGEVLEDQGMRAVLFGRAQAALDSLDREGGTPALIIVDLLMPSMGGVNLVGALRADERWRGIPVVAFTGWHDTAEVSIPVIEKPNIGALVELVDSIRRQRREEAVETSAASG
jgi:FixJ family two-component response regulator